VLETAVYETVRLWCECIEEILQGPRSNHYRKSQCYTGAADWAFTVTVTHTVHLTTLARLSHINIVSVSITEPKFSSSSGCHLEGLVNVSLPPSFPASLPAPLPLSLLLSLRPLSFSQSCLATTPSPCLYITLHNLYVNYIMCNLYIKLVMLTLLWCLYP